MCHSALQERYVNFYTDFAFKKLFGTEANKDLLISFLNSLFDGTEVIKPSTTSTWSTSVITPQKGRPSSTCIARTKREKNS